MLSQKIKGTACSIYCEKHHLPAVVVVYGSYTLEYNCHIPPPVASLDTSVRMHSTSHIYYGLRVVYLICTLEVRF